MRNSVYTNPSGENISFVTNSFTSNSSLVLFARNRSGTIVSPA